MNNTHASYDVVVVGGGASGMMSAYCLALRGYKVLILEKNTRLGEKVRISGGGRCNITNAEYDTRTLLKKYGKAEPYLYSLFAQFGVKDTFTFFESRGVTLVVEEHKRTFPKSYNANDVVRVFEQGLKETRVTVRNGEPVKEVLHEDGSITGIRTEFGVYTAKHYIFATGGVSHKETGSTGDGFGWLAKLGHTVIPATPSIVPLAVVDDWVKVIAGSTLQDVKVTFFVDDKKQFSCKGNVLCTHFGISGPTILNVASKVGVILPAGTVTAHIDLFLNF
jgi:predicted Rossmann fold flavoprotein